MKKAIICGILGLIVPGMAWAQDSGDNFHGLQRVLENLYNQMMPLCSQLIGVGRALAGFAALWYIASRVWGHIARAEPIDFYPLLRPFVIGFCIAIFPMVLNLINGILQPTVLATDAMVNNTNQALYAMLDGKKNETPPPAPDAEPSEWYPYSHPDETGSNPIADAFSFFNVKNLIKTWIAEVLEFFYQCAALCIDTIRTFKLIVLSILGPFVFGLSVFDGFQNTIRHWLGRYINVFMWLPVANIFGAITAKIQLNMMDLAAAGGSTGPFYGSTNTAYLIFLAIAIVGYFTVPSIAGYIVHAGGHALFQRTSTLASNAVSAYSGIATSRSTDMLTHFTREEKNADSKSDFQIKKITGKD